MRHGLVTTLASPLIDLFTVESASTLQRDLKVETLAEVLAQMPYDYVEPKPYAPISGLKHGLEVVIKGQITYRGEQHVGSPGFAGYATYPYVSISDGTDTLTCRWIHRANDVPPGMFPGTQVAVLGTPIGSRVREGIQSRIQWCMDDPEAVSVPDWRAPVPFFDAPGPRYAYDEETHSRRLVSAILIALEELLPFPESLQLVDDEIVSGPSLQRVLTAIHRPSSAEERNWGWGYREWARHSLMRIGRSIPLMPEPGLIKTPEDAENHACEVLRSMGFADADVTPPGADGGVDVRGSDVVAQVKLEGIKTDAPRIQALSGIAAHENRTAVFFSLSGYTKPAVAWAEQTGVALFEFDYSGSVKPCSSSASHMLYESAGSEATQVDPVIRQQVEEALREPEEGWS